MPNCLSLYLKGRGYPYMRVRPYLPPGPCPAEPLRTGKSQPNCGLFRTERRAKTNSTVPPRCTANFPKKVKGCTIPIPADSMHHTGMRLSWALRAFRFLNLGFGEILPIPHGTREPLKGLKRRGARFRVWWKGR
jgi:hypothetical protein